MYAGHGDILFFKIFQQIHRLFSGLSRKENAFELCRQSEALVISRTNKGSGNKIRFFLCLGGGREKMFAFHLSPLCILEVFACLGLSKYKNNNTST